MADHLFVTGWVRREPYTSPSRGGAKIKTPPRNRLGHGTSLRNKFEQAWLAAQARQRAVAVIPDSPNGFLVQFQSDPNMELDLEKLDLQKQGIQLAAVKNLAGVQLASVFVPDDKVQFFLKRFEDYLTQDTRYNRPKNRSLVESIADLRLATLESLWTEQSMPFPFEERKIWWEFWLRADGGNELNRFRQFADQLNLRTQQGSLTFVDRTVVLCEATPGELTRSLDIFHDLAELRLARELPTFFFRLAHREQAEWVEELLQRTTFADNAAPAVCVLDTGVARGHRLIEPALEVADLFTYDELWGVDDENGHGTEMAGLSLYGDLSQVLAAAHPIILNHRLESGKVYSPDDGQIDPELYGYINAVVASYAELENPHRKRVFLMAVTAPDRRDRGLPTSWSAALDDLSAGTDELESEHRRLFIISAGNREGAVEVGYFTQAILDGIHDPGQSWNALTVGAYTEKIVMDEPEFAGWLPLAQAGQLCPTSTTSRTWISQWPFKPDIVMEGGNYATDGAGNVDSPISLSVLTTNYQPLEREFTFTGDTSAAAALAAKMAAEIQARYPTAWPETIRAILVHSARWSEMMVQQTQLPTAAPKTNLETLLRCFGYGTPNLARALESTNNQLTLIAEETIYPFEADKSKEMMVHALPWPKEALLELGAIEVRMRVTLSYFIEANPARRGWTKRHRYASHGLRFDVKTATETLNQFRARLNQQAREEEDRAASSSDAAEWVLGPTLRKKGSIHSDIWIGTAVDLAERGFIGVFPVVGWWRERHQLGRSERGARYSLVVSIETEEAEVDFYVPVEALVEQGVPTETEVETDIEIETDWI